MRKLTSCILLFFTAISALWAQELQRVVPESPEAYAFSKYDKIPVNYHSGLPTIEIPLYTITTRSGLQIPLKLTYHASGIKVNEQATPVGLGWSLSAGGMISREVYGLADNQGYPRQYPMNAGEDIHTSLSSFDLFEYEDRPSSCIIPQDKLDDYTYAIDVMGLSNPGGSANPKSIDALPDIFYYATPSVSGKFILDIQGQAQTIPYEPVKIEVAGGPLDGFNITDPQGNRFEYHATATYMEIPQSDPYADFTEQSKLSRITTYLGEVIDFIYSNESYTYANPIPVTDYTPYDNAPGCTTPTHNPVPTQTQFNARRLEEIAFENGHVVFHYSDDPQYAIAGSTDRRDLPGASALRRVVVYNTNDVIIKDYSLDYSYFSSDPTALGDPDAHRLKLDAVTQAGEPPYVFTYFGDGYIPHRMSDQQDYWGYYGGSGGLLPEVHFGDVEIPGSDRSVDDNLIKTGSLQSITYPTKGTTTFHFNENDYISLQDEVQYIPTSTPVFNTKGTHIFTLPEDDNNSRKIYIQNDCGNTGMELEDILNGYCFFQLLDNQDNVVFQTTDSGSYTIGDLPGDPSDYKFVIDQLDVQNCNCSISMEGEIEDTLQVLKPSQLPGLRLDSMVSQPIEGEAITTTFDYTDPGTGQISKPTLLPRFHFLKKSATVDAASQIDPYCTFIQRNGSPVETFTSSGYQYVTVSQGGTGSTRYTFNTATSSREMAPLMHLTFGSFLAGLPAKTEQFHQDGRLLKSEESTYIVDPSLNSRSADYMPQQPGSIALGISFNPYGTDNESCENSLYHLIDYNIYNIPGGWVKKQSSTTTDYVYDTNGSLTDQTTQTISYAYENELHQQLTKTTVATSAGDTLITKTYYPLDINTQDDLDEGGPLTLSAYQAITELKDEQLHRLSVPIQIANYKKDGLGNPQLLSTRRTLYKDWGLGMILPEKVQTSKSGEALQDRIIYHNYDGFGNPLEISKAGGNPVSYIWGYGNTRPIIKLENISYSDIDPADIANLQSLSDTDTDALSEQALRDAIAALRDSLPQGSVSGFTYDPLVGVTSISDSRGYTSFYSYDAFNRLEQVKDNDGSTIEKMEYNYLQAPVVYDPLVSAIGYGSSAEDYQWFTAGVSGGSGDFNYVWFEGIGASSVDFEGSPSGTSDTYQLMVNCADTKYVKLVVTDNITGEVTEAVKVNNNACPYPPLNAIITYGPSDNLSQWFFANPSGGSGNYSYEWFQGIGMSSTDFEVTADGSIPSYMLPVPCSTYKYVKLVVTDTVTGLTVIKTKKSANSPCENGDGGGKPPVGDY